MARQKYLGWQCGQCGNRKGDPRALRCHKCNQSFYKKNGYPWAEHKRTQRLKKQDSLRQLGEKNSNWKGDNVGYGGLHRWVERKMNKPSMCDSCKKTGWLDLANISQEYKRALNDWEWLCRRCHMLKDGRLDKFMNYKKNEKEKM